MREKAAAANAAKPGYGKSPETPLRWSFQIDRESAYLPDGE